MLAFSQTAAEVQEPSAEPTCLPYRRPSRAEASALRAGAAAMRSRTKTRSPSVSTAQRSRASKAGAARASPLRRSKQA